MKCDNCGSSVGRDGLQLYIPQYNSDLNVRLYLCGDCHRVLKKQQIDKLPKGDGHSWRGLGCVSRKIRRISEL